MHQKIGISLGNTLIWCTGFVSN